MKHSNNRVKGETTMKKSICLLLIFVLLFACANPVLAAENGLEINAKSYILVEGYSGDVSVSYTHLSEQEV